MVDPPLLFYHISEKDGLADNLVNCFYQDKTGVMWMGTQYGLNSFDGSFINTWRASQGTASTHLTSNHINAIAGGAGDTLWIATDGGLSALDRSTKKMHSWQYAGENYMRSLAADGNTIWIGTSAGLLAFDISHQTFRRFENQADKRQPYLPRLDNDCNAVLLDHKHRLWLATVNGLWMFDIKTQNFTQYDGPLNDPFFDGLLTTLFEDHKGRLWAGAWSRGLKQIDAESRRVTSYNFIKNAPAHVMSIVEQPTKLGNYKLWLSGSLTDLDPRSGKFTPHNLKPVANAAPLEPRSLFVSRDNLLWVSTVKGVYIIDPQRQIFNNHFITTQPSITNQSAGLYDDGKLLWIGGDRSFILRSFTYDLKQVKDYTRAIRRLTARYQLPSPAVMSITKHNNELWLSTTSGIIRLNPKTDKLNLAGSQVSADPKVRTDFINNIYAYKKTLWAFPWRSGVWAYDTLIHKFEAVIISLSDGSKSKGLNFSNAVTDSLGNIWLSDLDFGLVRYTSATKQFQRVVNKDILPYTRISNIKNIDGRLWVVNFKSVVAIDPKTSATQSWPLPSGMNKYTYDYTNDRNHNLWIAAKTGLITFNTVTHNFNQYTEEDGLVNNDMNGMLHLMASGNIAYAGENYLTLFNPAELVRSPAPKRVLLSSVSADNNYLPLGDMKTVTVPPNTNKVSFKWSLINYTNPLQNHYYARLQGIDNTWNDTGTKGHIDYNNLPPGDYKFTYRGITADGLAKAEGTLLLKVKPAFWQTWFFKFGLSGLGILAVLLIIRRVKKTEQRKASLRVQLSELEMKALRAQMNPHFIFNALNSIQECIVTQKTEAAYNYLSNFSKLVRLILENSEKQFITLADEMETLGLYLAVEKLRFDDTFDYCINIAPDVDASFIRLPAMMIQPFVENALWHGLVHKKGTKTLGITVEQANDNLICTVTDNGIGRQRAAKLKPAQNGIKTRSLGMKIIAERLHLLKAESQIIIEDLQTDSGEGAGTRVKITIPLKY